MTTTARSNGSSTSYSSNGSNGTGGRPKDPPAAMPFRHDDRNNKNKQSCDACRRRRPHRRNDCHYPQSLSKSMIRRRSTFGRIVILLAVVGVSLSVVENLRIFLSHGTQGNSDDDDGGGGDSPSPTPPRYSKDDPSTGSHNTPETKATITTSSLSSSLSQTTAPHLSHNSSSTSGLPVLSFCLLIKDDNDILNEWIAYHYHVLNVRRIVVAVDPTSETSPQSLLETWEREFGVKYTLWTDDDYMPEKFVNGNYKDVPDMVRKEVKPHPDGGDGMITTIWHNGARQNDTQEQIRRDVTLINHHRYRQAVFVSQCYRTLQQEGKTWTAHIDTDEYVVVNPYLRQMASDINSLLTDTGSIALMEHWRRRQQEHGRNNTGEMAPLQRESSSSPAPATTSTLEVAIPMIPTAGSLLQFWLDMERTYPPFRDVGKYQHYSSKTCLMMPTLLFGAHEDENDNDSHHRNITGTTTNQPVSWNVTAFETLRWKYYGSLPERYNGYPKTIVNVHEIPSGHAIFRQGRVMNIHQPLPALGSPTGMTQAYCPGNMGKWYSSSYRMPFAQAALYRPLAIQHFLGSLERYLSRSDVRRNEAVFQKKARIVNGTKLSEEEDHWMKEWPRQFVEQHGVQKVLTVLKDHVVQ